MASRPKLTVSYTRQALSELDEIWEWNATHYNRYHATDYISFLEDHTDRLGDTYDEGKDIDGFPGLKRLAVRRSLKGQGHYVIYEIDRAAETINVLHIYHTRMDIEDRLKQEAR